MSRQSKFTPEARREIVLALLSERVTMAELCREHQVSSTAVYRWRDQFIEGGLRALQGNGPTQREADLERQAAELKKLVGDISLANYLLKRGVPGSTRSGGGRP